MSFGEDVARPRRGTAEVEALIDARVRAAETTFEELYTGITSEAASCLTAREAPRLFSLRSGEIAGWFISKMGLYLSTSQGLCTPEGLYLKGTAVRPFAALMAPGEILTVPSRIHVSASSSWGPQWEPTGTGRLDWDEGDTTIAISGDPVDFLAPANQNVTLRDALIKAIALQY